tara:strand:- start:137 stop:298 length:162 start_codon:yes stop_codon:yes gene_type:complete
MKIKKELIGEVWKGEGIKIEIKPQNADILKHLGADVFEEVKEVKPKKKKKDEN